MSIEDQPGYPGLTSKGVLALHADWPAYPVDHGWTTASFYLCSFPAETTFTVVDDIDRCLLLRADYPTKHPKGRRIEEPSPPGWHTAALPWPRWGCFPFRQAHGTERQTPDLPERGEQPLNQAHLRASEPVIRGSRTAGPARVLGRRLVRVGWPRNADFERSVPGSATRQIAGHVWGVRAVADVVASGVGDDVARHRAESRRPG